MGIAENPRKVENIVTGQMEQLEDLYANLFHQRIINDDGLVSQKGPDQYQLDSSPMAQRYMQSRLPFCKALLQQQQEGSDPARATEQCKDISDPPSFLKDIRRTVRWPSMVQSAKGLISANPTTVVSYVMAKLLKRFAK